MAIGCSVAMTNSAGSIQVNAECAIRSADDDAGLPTIFTVNTAKSPSTAFVALLPTVVLWLTP